MAAVVILPAVTFAAPADAAERLLPKLGSAMGLRLEADRREKPQVLLVRVAGMPQKRILSLVADATGANGSGSRAGIG